MSRPQPFPLWLPATLNEVSEACQMATGLNFTEYTKQSIHMLHAMGELGIRSSAQLETQMGDISFPSLKDGPEPTLAHLRKVQLGKVHTELETGAQSRGVSMQARARSGLRLANFLVQHEAFPYANVNYRDKKFMFIW